MTDIFIRVVEMSMTASIVIGVVMVLRLFLRKAPKVFSYVLWAAALFRLLCPISFELPSAPIPSVEIPYSTDVNDRNADRLFITNNDVEIAPSPEYSAPQTEQLPLVTAVPESVSETPVKREINYIAIASYIWAFAVIIMAFRGIISWARLSHSLRSAQKMGGNVYVSPAISDPFIMGIIRPKIYLPTGLSCTESDLIIRHEKTHMHRGDHIAKLVMYGALCVHCFNPLVWLMFRLFERDMEMSCDEKVTANMTKEQKADYSQTLLKISAKPTAAFTACFGESGTKQRIKNVLSFKKPAVWVVIVLTVVAVAVSVVLCINRGTEPDLVTVPDVYTLNYHEAERLLSNERLKYTAVFENSTEPKDTVLKTEPAKNEKIDADTPVIVYVSMGSENSSELILSMGINGIEGFMRREDYYGRNNEKYERHSEAVTDEEKTRQYREQLYPEYGEAIEQCTFICEYFLVPLYDEKGENVVDYYRSECGITPFLPDGEELVILESENGEREVYPKPALAELKSACDSYLTDYWSYITKTGELDPKKYTSDENTAELIEVVKLEFADTVSHGIDTVDVEIAYHNVEYDTVGDITWTYIRSYNVNWMNGGEIIRTEPGYNAYFEFKNTDGRLDMVCEIDLWRWHKELGIDPNPYEFPLNIDVSEAAKKIYAGQGHSNDMDIISEMGLPEVIENSEWWDMIFCSDAWIDIESLQNTIEIDGEPYYSEYRITDDLPQFIPNIEKALDTKLELAEGYYKCPFATVEEVKENARRLFTDNYIETVYKNYSYIKEYNGSIYAMFGAKGYPGGWIANAHIYDSSDSFIEFSATFVDGSIGTYSKRYKMIKEDGSWKIDKIDYIDKD